jgi:hypothetical protein
MSSIAITPNSAATEPWLSKKSLAAHYELSTRTVERWVHGGCPSRLIGGVRRLRLSEVEAFLARTEVT